MAESRAIISSRDTAKIPSVKAFQSDWGVSPEYIVTLKVEGDDTLTGTDNGTFYVSTSIDETFSLSMRSSWEAQMANAMNAGLDKLQGAAGSKGGAAIGAARLGAKAMGIETKNRASSAQVWQSSDPMGFNIPFTFVAKTDAKKDVADKVRNLLKLTAPSLAVGGFALQAPGPTIVGELANWSNSSMKGRRITLFIGTFLVLENCIVKAVDAQFDSLMGEDGIPHKAKVTVDIESYFTCFTVQDIDALFGVSS
jgi:hypothetical protein